jgi:hypothetical protein
MNVAQAGMEFANHLSDTDLALILSATAGPATAGAESHGTGQSPGAGLRGDPAALTAMLADRRVFQVVFGEPWTLSQPPPASPFLVFAIAVHRAAAELASIDYVPERTGLRQRVPVFDAPALRDFLAEPARRLFLAELLASFTKVASGRYQVQSGGRVRTRRYSELDPVRLAGLLDAVPSAERPGVYRRLGDVSLFLAGVFPDYATAHVLGPVNVARLLRAAQVPPPDSARLAAAPAIELLEHLGARWYRAARDLATVRTERLTVVAEVADRFRQSRRVLNHVTDRYLLPQAFPWMPRPGF